MHRATTVTASLAASLALLAAPAFAVSDNASDQGKANGKGKPEQTTPAPPATTPAPTATTQAKGKAYGKYCKAESKKHVKGQKGTAFSRCVTAMAKAANDDKSPTAKQAAKKACKTLSKKHVKGQKGTPYSRCIVAAAQLKKAQAQAPAPTTPGS